MEDRLDDIPYGKWAIHRESTIFIDDNCRAGDGSDQSSA